MTIILWAADLMTTCGIVAVIAGAFLAVRFSVRIGPPAPEHPPVTVLKPLCGDEPCLEPALASICDQDYADLQIVFGLRDPDDPALHVVRRIRARFPQRDIEIVIGGNAVGRNRKIANLLDMLPAARHDLLLFSDSDLHVEPDYVARVVACLGRPRVGLVTTLCTGLPTSRSRAASLGATAITHSFLPSVLIARALGRADCLGTTMALRRDTLARTGGLHALLDHVGDDNVLGQRVRGLGLDVVLAPTVPMTAVSERSFYALWQHELRWARTIRALEPFLFATSIVQYPIFWAALALLLSPGAVSLALFVIAWSARALAADRVSRALQPGLRPDFGLLPLRDIMSAAIVVASYVGARVIWRGQAMRVSGYRQGVRPGALPLDPAGSAAPRPAYSP